jgi:hypothetical protein
VKKVILALMLALLLVVVAMTPAIAVPTIVDIDIRPGSDSNSINLGARGLVPVAVLTTDDFDATTVDPVTVSFAGALPLRWATEDVDGDGDLNLLFHFKTRELQLDMTSTEGTPPARPSMVWSSRAPTR